MIARPDLAALRVAAEEGQWLPAHQTLALLSELEALRADPPHLYREMCPDETQPDARDPDCPACQLRPIAGEALRAREAQPLNGIPANWFHGEGAIARCSYCGRYSLDPKTLGEDRYQPVCECGEKHGWSGSFKKPGPDAKWSGAAPPAPASQPTFEGPARWTDEEVADGHKGIRWITKQGVAGRPTKHDVRLYLEQRGDAADCSCAECRQWTASQPDVIEAARTLAEFAKTAPGRLPQHVQDAIAALKETK